MSGSFTLTGRFLHHDRVTPLADEPIVISAAMYPDGTDDVIYTRGASTVTDADGSFSIDLLVETDLYYTVTSTSVPPMFDPITFLAQTAGSTHDLSEFTTTVPASVTPSVLADALAAEAGAIAAATSATTSAASAVAAAGALATGRVVSTKPRPAVAQVVLTFDDCPTTDWTVVKPILDAAGVKACFCILTSTAGSTGMSWAQITTLGNSGHELVAHSRTHIDERGLSASSLASEITGAFTDIFTNTGIMPRGHCWPLNAHDAPARALAAVDGEYAIGSGSTGFNTQPFKSYAIARQQFDNTVSLATAEGWVDTAIATNATLVILNHSATDLDSTHQGYLTSLIAYCASHSVPIRTMSQALAASGNFMETGDFFGGTNYTVAGGDGRFYSSSTGAGGLIRQVRAGTNITINTAGTFTAVDSSALNLVFTARTGDWLEVGLSARVNNEAVQMSLDAQTMVGATPTPTNSLTQFSSGFPLPAAGVGAWLCASGQLIGVGGSVLYQVQAGDIASGGTGPGANGTVTVRLMAATATAVNRNILCGSSGPVMFWGRNLGQ